METLCKILNDAFVSTMRERGYNKILSNKFTDFKEITKLDSDTCVSLSLDCLSQSAAQDFGANSKIEIRLKDSKIIIATFWFTIDSNNTIDKALDILDKVLSSEVFDRLISYRCPRVELKF